MSVQVPVLGIPNFAGRQLVRGDVGYDEARKVFNGMIDRSPALIARCTSPDDVSAAVGFAREGDLPLTVYGGGHSINGAAVIDDGLVIDLRELRSVQVDPKARTVDVGGGCTWGELDAATQEHGLAVTGGRVPSTGVGGLALGSGSGWLERFLGYTCDNLLEAEVVVADGRIVRAAADENPDLFWALRGGGGNFGVVTRFRFALHQVGPMIYGGMVLYPPDAAADVLRHYRDYMATAPDEVGGAVAFICAPPVDGVPREAWGQPVVGVIISYAGDPVVGAEVVGPLVGFGAPLLSQVGPIPYLGVQRLIEAGNPHGMQNYWTADFLFGLPDEAIEGFVAVATAPVSPMTQITVIPGGGAVARVPDGDTAFAQRQAAFNVHYLSMWPDPADNEKNIDYTRRLAATLKPWATGRVYLNFIGDEGQERVDHSFPAGVLERLREVKRRWDPDNMFRNNHNIKPAAG